nr:HNH endonuclease family protein [Streptomyces sulphureus]
MRATVRALTCDDHVSVRRGRAPRATRRAGAALSAVLAAAVLAGCEGTVGSAAEDPSGTASSSRAASPPPETGPSSSPASPLPSGKGEGTSPLKNPDGTEPGLARLVSEQDRAAARRTIDRVTTDSPRTDGSYHRDAFGYAWKDTVDGVPLGGNGCDTRNDVLARDGRELSYRAGSDCVVESMRLHDPYTGKELKWRKEKAAEVQIDHVIPLSYAWRFGASEWSDSQRQRLANDPLNLLPVDGGTNGGKSDSGPSDWLPPSTEIRCSYATRFAQVALAYRLPVSKADKRTMLDQCAT